MENLEVILKEPWNPETLKQYMKSYGITAEEVAAHLDIPVQRVRSALKKGKYEDPTTHFQSYNPNPHIQSTRTLIAICLMAGLCSEREAGE